MIFNHISTSLLLFTSLFIGGQSSTSNTKSMDAQETDGDNGMINIRLTRDLMQAMRKDSSVIHDYVHNRMSMIKNVHDSSDNNLTRRRRLKKKSSSKKNHIIV
jgi:hypothetical protein